MNKIVTPETAMTVVQRIMDPASRANPYPLYEALRERPVWLEPDGSYVISRYADVAPLIRDPRVSSESAGGMGLSFLNMDPPRHGRLRRMTMRHFGPPHDPGRVEAMSPALQVMIDDLIDKLADRHEFDLVAEVSYPYPVTVICELLGVPREDEPKFQVWAEAIVQAQDRDPTDRGKRPESAVKALQELGAYMFGLITERQRAPRDDMLSRIANDDGPDGRMEPIEMIEISVLLLLAGHETTVNLISNGMLTLLRRPDILKRLRDDPDLAAPLVEELLRYDAPVHFTFRQALSDIEIGGETIPTGAPIILMLAAASRDPQRFESPDVFMPDRPNNQHLGFGSGIHSCFGAPLARLDAQIALATLARRLRNPRLLQDTPPYRYSASLRGPREVLVGIDGID